MWESFVRNFFDESALFCVEIDECSERKRFGKNMLDTVSGIFFYISCLR